MKRQISIINDLIVDVISTATSVDRLKALSQTPLYSNALYLMLANIANALFGFVFWIVAARFYSSEDVGFASAAISAASLLAMLSSLGLGYGLIGFLRSSRNPDSLINSSLTIVGLVSTAAALIFILGLDAWSPALIFIRDIPIYLVVFVLFIPVSAVSGLVDHTFVAGCQAGFVVARNLIFNILRLALSVLLAVFFHSFGIFGSWSGSLAVSLLVGIFWFLPRAQSGYHPRLTINRKAASDVLRFSFANHIGDIFWTAPALILPIMVVNLVGAGNNAFFYIAWAISGILTMIPGNVSISLFAEGSHGKARLEQNVLRSLKMVFLLLVPAVILVLALADKILLLFGGPYSQGATTLLRLLAVSALPVAINAVYFGMIRTEKKIKTIIGLSAFIGVVTIGLSFLLLPRIGITGAGIAWLVSHTGAASAIVIRWLTGRQKAL